MGRYSEKSLNLADISANGYDNYYCDYCNYYYLEHTCPDS